MKNICRGEFCTTPAEVYFTTGEELPENVPMGSTALNVDTMESYIFTGTEWKSVGV